MVYVNSKKYACESCIKGHRSSSCHHNDRPLFEIKKKGRPVSQCEKCREARQNRRIHAKCTCGGDKNGDHDNRLSTAASRKGKRFIPTVPSLPNGLRDAFKNVDTLSEELTSQKRPVDALLNPCNCKDVYNCTCRSQSLTTSSTNRKNVSSIFDDGLSALAHVAACCSPASASPLPRLPPLSKMPTESRPFDRNGTKVHFEPSAQLNASALNSIGVPRVNSEKSQATHMPPQVLEAGPSFQAITPAISISEHSMTLMPPAPENTEHASTSHIHSSSIMGDDCGCGQRCECDGCSLHGTAESHSGHHSHGHARHSHQAETAQECPSCVDYAGGIELPPLQGQKRTPTFLDQFFARSASLPAPPPASTRARDLNPTNITVYPPGIFSTSEVNRKARELAFGLVRIPKLECCGGQCSCPENTCGCGSECSGCCVDKSENHTGTRSRRHLSPSISFTRQTTLSPSSKS